MRLLTAVVLALFVLPAPVSAQLSLAWDPVEHVEGHTIYGSTESTHPQWAVDVENVTTWTYRTGQPGVRYYFWVAAWRTAEPTEFGVRVLRSPFGEGQPIEAVYEGSTAPPPPPPLPPDAPPVPPVDPVPSPVPTELPPGTQLVDPQKNVWTLTNGVVGLNGAYLTLAEYLALKPVKDLPTVVMRQGSQWFVWDAAARNWLAVGADDPSTPLPPTEICGDKIDNDGDGQIDEPDAGCLPPPPPPPDPCIVTPLRITNLSWPSAAAGSRQFRYTSSQPLARVLLMPGTATTRSAIFTDTRGCTVTVK